MKDGKKVRIYEVTQEDLPFLEHLSSQMEKYMDTCGIEERNVNNKKMIMETTINVMKEKLKLFPKETKTHFYLAESDGKICGALAGGLPKKAPNGTRLYSARKDANINETELNWFATWPQGGGVGKAMLAEFMNTMGKDGFKRLFIQSEIPKLSKASIFYERMGNHKIHKLSPERYVLNVEYNKDILPSLRPNADGMYNYKIVPMGAK